MFLLSFAPTRCKTNKFFGGYRALFIERKCLGRAGNGMEIIWKFRQSFIFEMQSMTNLTVRSANINYWWEVSNQLLQKGNWQIC